jgi:hypothetical protein
MEWTGCGLVTEFLPGELLSSHGGGSAVGGLKLFGSGCHDLCLRCLLVLFLLQGSTTARQVWSQVRYRFLVDVVMQELQVKALHYGQCQQQQRRLGIIFIL